MRHAIVHEGMQARVSGRPLRQSVIASFLRVLLMSELILTLALAATAAQPPFHQKAVFEQRPVVTIANGKLELTINERGGAFVNLVLLDDAERLSPLWNPVRHARELGEANQFGEAFGHFVCVDGSARDQRRSGPRDSQTTAKRTSSHGKSSSRTRTGTPVRSRFMRTCRSCTRTLRALYGWWMAKT